MRQIRSQTKVIATIGPASSTKEVLKKMIEEGVDVFRLNFSHSNLDEHLERINLIKELNSELGTSVSVLADLQGPKLRIGEIENNGIELCEGEIITFVSEKCTGTKEGIFMSYPDFPRQVKPGENILIDDGKIKLEVIDTDGKDRVRAKVIFGGLLSSKKGVNLPDTVVSLPSLTHEDITNAQFAIRHEVDWIALSFVRKASDVSDLRKLINAEGSHAGIIAKIEKPEALKEIEGIIELADALMVARGDLGVEVPFDQVPLVQKMIVNKCIEHSRPVIIATQMMESMITNFTPTRAEANDVANAVLDGADALMLSGETSIGKFPAETIRNMQKIIDSTEANGHPFNRQHAPREENSTFLADSVCFNATLLAQQVNAKAIVTFTHSGYTAFRISSHRPEADIFAFTDNDKLLKKMSLVWGVRAYKIKTCVMMDEAINESVRILKEKKLISNGDIVVHIGSIPFNQKGSTNTMKVSYV